jgi:hypothetical protein
LYPLHIHPFHPHYLLVFWRCLGGVFTSSVSGIVLSVDIVRLNNVISVICSWNVAVVLSPVFVP